MSKYRHIAYKEQYDFNTGAVKLLTPCPYGTRYRVASDDCWHCKHFLALYQSQEIECANPIQFRDEPMQLDLFANSG